MIRRPPRSTPLYSSAASDVYKRQPGSRPERPSAWGSTRCRPPGTGPAPRRCPPSRAPHPGAARRRPRTPARTAGTGRTTMPTSPRARCRRSSRPARRSPRSARRSPWCPLGRVASGVNTGPLGVFPPNGPAPASLAGCLVSRRRITTMTETADYPKEPLPDGWLTDAELTAVRSRLPILYVDAIPVRVDECGDVVAVGLLLRVNGSGEIMRSLVSGRVMYHERVRDALLRHLEEPGGRLQRARAAGDDRRQGVPAAPGDGARRPDALRLSRAASRRSAAPALGTPRRGARWRSSPPASARRW